MKVDGAMVRGCPPVFQVLFSKQDRVDNYRGFTKSNNELFAKMQERILTKGIMLGENNGERPYTSAAHNDSDLMHTLEAFEASLPFRAHEKPHNR
jgi:glutamate-1-semialdehyde aminotransferase